MSEQLRILSQPAVRGVIDQFKGKVESVLKSEVSTEGDDFRVTEIVVVRFPLHENERTGPGKLVMIRDEGEGPHALHPDPDVLHPNAWKRVENGLSFLQELPLAYHRSPIVPPERQEH